MKKEVVGGNGEEVRIQLPDNRMIDILKSLDSKSKIQIIWLECSPNSSNLKIK